MNQKTALFAKLLKAKLPLIYKRLHTRYEEKKPSGFYTKNERWWLKSIVYKKRVAMQKERGERRNTRGWSKSAEINFITSAWVIITLLQCWKSRPHIYLLYSHLYTHFFLFLFCIFFYFAALFFHSFNCTVIRVENFSVTTERQRDFYIKHSIHCEQVVN